MQFGEEDQYCIFGDSAYMRLSHLETYYSYANPDMMQHVIAWNKAMKHVRISIEWNYMVTSHLFHYVGSPEKLQILKNSRVSKIYIVATLFRNFHGALYGNQS